jgi:hypothetical protein
MDGTAERGRDAKVGAIGAAPRLTFLGWDRPPLHTAADLLLAEASPDGPADFTGHAVVLPGARAGRRLLELLLERCEAVGRPLRPPRIAPVGVLPELLYRPSLPSAGVSIDRLAWTRALEETPRSSLAAVFPDFADHPSNRSLLALAETVRGLSAEVGASGKDFTDVAAICRTHLFFSDEERWRVLSGIQDRYRLVLAGMGFLDRESARREALASGRVEAPNDLWIIGAPDLPAVTRAFVSAASGEIRILVAAPDAYAQRFDALGCVVPDAWTQSSAGLEDRAIEFVPDPEAQADAVVARLARAGARIPAEDAVIGIPDREVVPYLVERLGEAGVAVRDAQGRAIGATAAFRLLDAIADVADASDFDRFSALLRHPDVDDWLRVHMEAPPVSIPALADAYRALHLPSRLPARGMPPSGGESDSAPLAAPIKRVHDALDRILAPLRRSGHLSRWGETIGAVFSEFYGDRTLRRHSPGDRELVALAQALGRVLGEIESLPGEMNRTMPGAEALRFVLDQIRGETVPPAQDEGAIELLGWLELPLDDAPFLVLTGANEPHLPESVAADPFLPHGIRQAIGLLDNDGRWARDLLYLQTILATREHVSVVASRRDASRNPLRPSRLLLAEEAEVVARRILAFLDPDADERQEESSDSGVPAPEPMPPARGSHLPPQPRLSAPAVPTWMRVTDFRLFLSDPYRFALERVLGLVSQDPLARELDGPAFGSLAHEVLQAFAGASEAASADPREISRALGALLDGAASRRFGREALPAVRVQIEQLRARFAGFAHWQAAWVESGWRIERVEVSPPGDGVAFPVDDEPILLRGKVDRVDHNIVTGEWCVLDYKTGDGGLEPDAVHRAGPAKARRWIDLQLPLYHRIVPALRAADGSPLVPPEAWPRVRVGYVVLSRDPEATGVRFADWSDAELAEAEEVARAVVRRIRANRFDYSPQQSAIPMGDPLAAVVGRGVLRLDSEDDDGDR